MMIDVATCIARDWETWQCRLINHHNDSEVVQRIQKRYHKHEVWRQQCCVKASETEIAMVTCLFLMSDKGDIVHATLDRFLKI